MLLSGGMDSAVVLAEAVAQGRRCTALSFDYGQRHRVELAAAANLAQALGAARHVVLPIGLRDAVGGSALTADIDVPKDRPDAELAAQAAGEAIPSTYVPARNLIFLSCAAGLAEAEHANEIWIGANAVDYSGYPDCRPAFLEAFERCVNLATAAGVGGRPFRVVAPLLELTKADIIRRGVELGVDFAQTISCYDPPGSSPLGSGPILACGHCDACVLRRRGFEQAGVPDPTRYTP